VAAPPEDLMPRRRSSRAVGIKPETTFSYVEVEEAAAYVEELHPIGQVHLGNEILTSFNHSFNLNGNFILLDHLTRFSQAP